MQELSEIRLCAAGELDLEKTFECGQCFRWNRRDDAYIGIVRGRAARLFYRGGDVMIECAAEDIPLWHHYFDMDLDYSAISFGDAGEYFAACEEFGRGIRILRQEFWEALCSFIISQCNNIPRIKGIVESLCQGFGEPLEFRGEIYYSFPGPDILATLSPGELAPLRAGYRAPYIISAARAVSLGELTPEALGSREEAVRALCGISGVGKKVASCTALYGLHDMTGFPIDTWMKRALANHFPEDFTPEVFGEYAGLAQQYIFYYARTNGASS